MTARYNQVELPDDHLVAGLQPCSVVSLCIDVSSISGPQILDHQTLAIHRKAGMVPGHGHIAEEDGDIVGSPGNRFAITENIGETGPRAALDDERVAERSLYPSDNLANVGGTGIGVVEDRLFVIRMLFRRAVLIGHPRMVAGKPLQEVETSSAATYSQNSAYAAGSMYSATAVVSPAISTNQADPYGSLLMVSGASASRSFTETTAPEIGA